jgi:hypothetical protein
VIEGTLRTLLIALDAVVAHTATPGGVAMATGIERFPPEWLARTPFHSYRIPGALLAALVGGSAAVATALLIANRQAGALASIVAGLILAGWIAIEVRVLTQPATPTRTETTYFASGIAIAVLAFALLLA